jgi:hypothetical protein
VTNPPINLNIRVNPEAVARAANAISNLALNLTELKTRLEEVKIVFERVPAIMLTVQGEQWLQQWIMEHPDWMHTNETPRERWERDHVARIGYRPPAWVLDTEYTRYRTEGSGNGRKVRE